MQELLTVLVKSHDHDIPVFLAETVETALDYWRTHKFVLILCDLGLSGGEDGMLFVRSVRRSGDRVPIVLVTGSNDRATVVEGARHRVSGFIVKPFDPELVAERLKPYLERSIEASLEVTEPTTLLDWLSELEARFPHLSIASGEDVDLASSQAETSVSVRELARRWGADVALTARLISVANSQLMKRHGQSVKTVLEAINVLGVDMSSKLVLAERLRQSDHLKHPYLRQLAKTYSERSLAIANQVVVWASPRRLNVTLCYTAGIMAYVGEQTILEAVQQFIDEALATVEMRDIDEAVATLGSRYGNYVKTRWRLPLELRERVGAIHKLPEGAVKAELILMRAAAQKVCGRTDSPEYVKLMRQLGLDNESGPQASDTD